MNNRERRKKIIHLLTDQRLNQLLTEAMLKKLLTENKLKILVIQQTESMLKAVQPMQCSDRYCFPFRAETNIDSLG